MDCDPRNPDASLYLQAGINQIVLELQGAFGPIAGDFATATNQLVENILLNQIAGSTASIDAKLTNPLPVSGPLTDAELRATPVPVSGTVTATPPTSATATTTTPTSASTTQVLKAANANRKGLIIYNKANKILTICLSGTATTATGFPLAAEVALIGGYWECPFGYTGDVSGIWELLPTGTAVVTELT